MTNNAWEANIKLPSMVSGTTSSAPPARNLSMSSSCALRTIAGTAGSNSFA